MRTVCLSSSFARVANWLTVRSSQTIVCISNQDIAFMFALEQSFILKEIVASKLPRSQGIQISSEVFSLAWCSFIMAAKKKFAEEFTVQSFWSNHRDKENFHFWWMKSFKKSLVSQFFSFAVEVSGWKFYDRRVSQSFEEHPRWRKLLWLPTCLILTSLFSPNTAKRWWMPLNIHRS